MCVMERRKSLKRKKEHEMGEQETRHSSVRARIAEFESYSRDRAEDASVKERNNQATAEKRESPESAKCSYSALALYRISL